MYFYRKERNGDGKNGMRHPGVQMGKTKVEVEEKRDQNKGAKENTSPWSLATSFLHTEVDPGWLLSRLRCIEVWSCILGSSP